MSVAQCSVSQYYASGGVRLPLLIIIWYLGKEVEVVWKIPATVLIMIPLPAVLAPEHSSLSNMSDLRVAFNFLNLFWYPQNVGTIKFK